MGEVQIPAPRRLRGSLATPTGPGPWPGVVVIHDAAGMTPDLRAQAEWLAGAGYLAVAPDLYSRGGKLRCVVSTIRDIARGRGPAFDDVDATRSWLAGQPGCTGHIGVIGFCMGGRLTYLAAAHHANDIKAAVPYYPGGLTMGNPSPLSRTGEIKCPMYLFFGAKDQLIPMDQVGQINTELTSKKVAFQMKTYPEAGHGFICDERGSYHEASAKDAWEKTKSFFAQHLK